MATIVVLLCVVAAAAWGLQRGLSGIFFVVVGLIVGVVAATNLASPIADAVGGDPDQRVLLRVVAALVLVAVGGSLGAIVGSALHLALPGVLRTADGALGALGAIVGAAIVAGVLAAVAAQSGSTSLAGSVRDSPLLRKLATSAPAVAVSGNLSELLRTADWPEVFADLSPVPGQFIPEPARGNASAGAAVRAATVKIKGPGCGGVIEGSGVVLAPGVVATNAHVVAGVDRLGVEPTGDGGPVPATAVLVDPRNDVAILRAPGLRAAPLALAAQTPTFGADGTVLGYPQDGPLTIVPARVGVERSINSRDIYDEPVRNRPILVLRARVRPGNSGGPVVSAQGRVAGLIFAAALDRKDVAFAVPLATVRAALASARTRTQPVDTGACSR